MRRVECGLRLASGLGSTVMVRVQASGDPFVAMRRLLTENHEPRKRQLQHIRGAVGIARSLVQAGVLERLHESEPVGRRYRLTVDLPPDFALNQPLSTFALAAVDVLDPASETFARMSFRSSTRRWRTRARSWRRS